MNDFDPVNIAARWQPGEGSAMHEYSVTDRVPTEDFKSKMVSEIETAMAGADGGNLEELEFLLAHIEESHPDRYPDSEMHEAWAFVDNEGNEDWHDNDDADIRDLYLDDEASGGKTVNISPEDRVRGIANSVWEGDGDGMCVECGGMKLEGSCDCSVEEGLTAESALRDAVRHILTEMKLGVASRGHFDFGGAEEMDIDDIAHMLLGKKKDVPTAPKSGVRTKAKAKPIAAKRKSKKVA